jgi:hypothetical protein
MKVRTCAEHRHGPRNSLGSCSEPGKTEPDPAGDRLGVHLGDSASVLGGSRDPLRLELSQKLRQE